MKKTLIRRIAPAMLVLMALVSLSFMAKDGVTLRLKPQQGKTYTITSKANMMMMIEVQGQSINQSQTVETRQTFIAKEVTANQSTFETQVEAIKMSMSNMGMKFEYDSEHPEKTSPMLAGQTKAFDEAINKPTTVSYDLMGKVMDSQDLEASQLGSAIIEFPEKEVTVGYTWDNNKSQSVSGIDIDVKMTYTVTAISKKSVDLSFTGRVESSEVTGDYTGTASVDPQTGLITTSTTKTNISMTISEQGMSLPVTMVGTTTVEVK